LSGKCFSLLAGDGPYATMHPLLKYLRSFLQS